MCGMSFNYQHFEILLSSLSGWNPSDKGSRLLWSKIQYISIKHYCIIAQKTVTIKSNMLPECWYLSTIPHAITPIKCKLNIYCCLILSLRSSFGLCESSTKSLLYSSGESWSGGQVKWKGTYCLSVTICSTRHLEQDLPLPSTKFKSSVFFKNKITVS